MKVFRNKNQTKTAKEYVDEKRNFNIFYDLNNNPEKNKLTCIKNSKITKFVNHETLINVSRGYHDYYQNGKCVAKKSELITKYDADVFSKKCEKESVDNSDIDNNYTGLVLTTNTNTVSNTVTDLRKEYAGEQVLDFTSDDNTHFNYKKKVEDVNCFTLHSSKMKEM